MRCPSGITEDSDVCAKYKTWLLQRVHINSSVFKGHVAMVSLNLTLSALSAIFNWLYKNGRNEMSTEIPNSPQRLLPLISTVTTATTSKSGSREPDLFFHFYF